MSRILVVDDDDAFRPALQGSLQGLGHEVLTAANGKKALEVLEKNTFDLVISDIRMPEMDGIALTQHVRSAYNTPVILITGFSEILETFDAHELGAEEFLPKPFHREDLIRAINRCLKPQAKGKVEEKNTFCRLAIDDFRSGRQIQFGIYIRLADTKYIKVAARGEDLSVDRIKAYKERGVRYLYMEDRDFLTYVGFDLKLSDAQVKATVETAEARKELLRKTNEIIANQINRDGIDSDLMDSSVAFVETVVAIASEDPDVYRLLQSLNTHTDYLFAHSVGVALFSVMIAQKVEWKLPTNKFKVALGALLHDVGHREIDQAMLMRPKKNWSANEVKLYESHSLRSMELLGRIKSIPNDVLQIAKEHHEDCLSHGFPSKLSKSAIHPMTRLVTVANEFCSRAIRNPHVVTVDPETAIKQMIALSSDRLDHVFFEALMRIFDFQPPSSFTKLRQKV
ncbi:MAG: response regulator [Bdellovibrionales bacterium]|nr:response regulator [Bdellovibrionales bacterium]